MSEKELKIDLGSGHSPAPGYKSLDISEEHKPDYVCDLEGAVLPFENDSVTEFRASHVFEHIENFIPLMNELYRCLKPGGLLRAMVPIDKAAFQDPTHVRFFNAGVWQYFSKDINQKFPHYGITTNFVIAVDPEKGPAITNTPLYQDQFNGLLYQNEVVLIKVTDEMLEDAKRKQIQAQNEQSKEQTLAAVAA